MSRLLALHNARLRAIDPNAGPAGPLAEPVVEAAHVAGGIRTHRYVESDDAALWGPLVRHVLHLRWSGERSPDPALSALLRRITSASSWRGDAGAALVWPSHDLACAGSFVRHGMTPLTVLGMRVLRKNPPSRSVRPAETGHLDAITDMAVRLHDLEASLGVLPTRSNMSERLLGELTAALRNPVHRVFIAAEGDSIIGFVHAQLPHGAWIESQVTPAPAGYVSRMFVDPAKRGKGVGTALAASVENELVEHGARVALLHYSLHNPGAAALWVKRDYRSVLTTWSLRPSDHLHA